MKYRNHLFISSGNILSIKKDKEERCVPLPIKEGVVKMDQKHRDYCIRLGNPYYIKESQQYEELDNSSWDNFAINNNSTNDNLPNNSKKFTN